MEYENIVRNHIPVIVSEGVAIESAHEHIELSARKGGSLTGVSKERSSEFLNIWK